MSAPVTPVVLGKVLEPIQTWVPERDFPGGTMTYIDLSSVDQERKEIVNARGLLCAEAPSRARQLVKAGDVLVSTVRPNLNAVAVVPDHMHGATASTGFCVLRPQFERACSRFLFHWVRSPTFIDEMVRRATGASYPAVSDRIVHESKVPLPRLREQRRIAEILDKADSLRAKRRAAIAQLDALAQSIFLDMFGDPVKKDRQWPTERMERLMTIRRGGSPRPIDKYLGGDINWIKIGDGTRGSDIYLEQCAEKITRDGLKKTVFLKAGSLIFANCGVSLGFARILKIDGCIHDGWLAFEEISENRLDKLFRVFRFKCG